MSDETRAAFDSDNGTDAGHDEEPRVVIEEDTTGIAWGFVAFLVFATLLAIFIIQNNEQVTVRFLWITIEMTVGIIMTLTVLITLMGDQLVSFLYRRRKRRDRRQAREDGQTTETD